MSNPLKMVDLFKALLPPGSAWKPVPDGDFDRLLHGMTDEAENVFTRGKLLAFIREPLFTPVLSDLEKEYGVATNQNITEDARRNILHSIVYAKRSTGTAQYLQERLQEAGFDLVVQENSPPVDPVLLITTFYKMYANGSNAYAGYIPLGGPPSTAIAGWNTQGEWIVNGPIYTQSIAYSMQASGPFAYAGNSLAISGYFTSMNRDPYIYPSVIEEPYWPLVFFVAKAFPNWPTLTDIEPGQVLAAQRDELRRIILKYKPLGIWGGLIVDYI